MCLRWPVRRIYKIKMVLHVFVAHDDQISLSSLLKTQDRKPHKTLRLLNPKANMDESTHSKASEEKNTKESAVEQCSF